VPEAVNVDRLVKWYGRRPAVRDVSFAIDTGEIVGLLGPNGSGKSTVLRILAGYLPPSAGTVRVAGSDIGNGSPAARRHIGYVPEDAPLYDGMRVGEFLRFMAHIKGCAGRSADSAAARVSERLELDAVLGTPIGKLSRGYRQRAAIAQALLNEPQVLLLDEPTSALDAYQVIAIRDLVRSLRGQCTVVMASHVLAEIEKVASRIMILVNGKLLTVDAMRQAPDAPRFRLRVAGPRPRVLACLEEIPGVSTAAVNACVPDEPPAYIVEALPGYSVAENLAWNLVERGFALSQLETVKPDLEQVFLALTKEATAATR
jgi:ABC-2 type transport system ATP-binding protein